LVSPLGSWGGGKNEGKRQGKLGTPPQFGGWGKGGLETEASHCGFWIGECGM